MNLKRYTRPLVYKFRKWLAENMQEPTRFYYKNLWKPKKGTLQEVLHEFSRAHPQLFFIQVGGNDGFINDPLYKFIRRDRWRGIVIEPQKRPYLTLRKLYAKERITVVNKAIDTADGYRELYKLSISDARWASGLSTFNRNQLEKYVASGEYERRLKKEGLKRRANEEAIIAERIECITFSSLLEQAKAAHVHLLETDTEGFDYEILKMFDFEKHRPELVIYEHAHFDAETSANCESYLKGYGYELSKYGGDTVARLKAV